MLEAARTSATRARTIFPPHSHMPRHMAGLIPVPDSRELATINHSFIPAGHASSPPPPFLPRQRTPWPTRRYHRRATKDALRPRPTAPAIISRTPQLLGRAHDRCHYFLKSAPLLWHWHRH
ncbi:hypothetical protein ZWY2020_053781 [Hordeum vulgare]|nr:hypothetical protein ZWY2020_053781 [Hordeum vulgare]